MDDELIAAIHADPSNSRLRADLARRWAGTPEGDLVATLMARPGGINVQEIRSWFERNTDWPDPGPDNCGEIEARSSMTLKAWIASALDPECWPDQSRRRSAILAFLRHILTDAQTLLPADHPDRTNLEELESAIAADPPRVATYWSRSSGDTGRFVAIGPGDRNLGGLALWAAQTAHASIRASPWDPWSEVARMELIPQYRILGWSWLGLPPLTSDGRLRFDVPVADAATVATTDRPSWLRSLWGRFFDRPSPGSEA